MIKSQQDVHSEWLISKQEDFLWFAVPSTIHNSKLKIVSLPGDEYDNPSSSFTLQKLQSKIMASANSFPFLSAALRNFFMTLSYDTALDYLKNSSQMSE